jgi:hypothetical protein
MFLGVEAEQAVAEAVDGNAVDGPHRGTEEQRSPADTSAADELEALEEYERVGFPTLPPRGPSRGECFQSGRGQAHPRRSRCRSCRPRRSPSDVRAGRGPLLAAGSPCLLPSRRYVLTCSFARGETALAPDDRLGDVCLRDLACDLGPAEPGLRAACVSHHEGVVRLAARTYPPRSQASATVSADGCGHVDLVRAAAQGRSGEWPVDCCAKLLRACWSNAFAAGEWRRRSLQQSESVWLKRSPTSSTAAT